MGVYCGGGGCQWCCIMADMCFYTCSGCAIGIKYYSNAEGCIVGKN